MVILGDSNIGKTSLVTRFAEGYYRDGSAPATIGASFVTKRIQSTQIHIWDTAGTNSFRGMAPMFYNRAAAVVVCYDTTRRETFEGMRDWLDEVRRKELVVVIAALKTDLVREGHAAAVPQQEVEQLAEALGVPYFSTSAKTDMNVKALFQCVADQVLELRRNVTENGATENNAAAPFAGSHVNDEGNDSTRAPAAHNAKDRLDMSSPRQFDKYYISNNHNTTNIDGSCNDSSNKSQPGKGISVTNGKEEFILDETPQGSSKKRTDTPSTGDCTSATEEGRQLLITRGSKKKESNNKESPLLEEPNYMCQAMTCGAVEEGNSSCIVQ